MLTQFAVLFPASDPEPVQQPSLLASVKEWFWGFGQAYAGAVGWSLTLLAIAFLVRYSGGDLTAILNGH